LRDASETARYLSLCRFRPGHKPGWLDKPASEYFKPEDAEGMVNKGMRILKKELGIVL